MHFFQEASLLVMLWRRAGGHMTGIYLVNNHELSFGTNPIQCVLGARESKDMKPGPKKRAFGSDLIQGLCLVLV